MEQYFTWQRRYQGLRLCGLPQQGSKKRVNTKVGFSMFLLE